MTNGHDEAAAFHGLAQNVTVPIKDRLAMALQALDLHEKLWLPVVEAAVDYERAWTEFSRTPDANASSEWTRIRVAKAQAHQVLLDSARASFKAALGGAAVVECVDEMSDDDACADGHHVWTIIEETADGVVVECYDCGADAVGTPAPDATFGVGEDLDER